MTRRRSLSESIEFVFGAIEAAGVAIPPGSRFDLMRRVFTDSTGAAVQTVAPQDPNFGVAKEALREFLVLEAILESAEAMSLPDEKRTLKRLCKDAVSPTNSGNTPGRDLQTELLVAATCCRGGFSNVQLEEPDVTAMLADRKWGIAVKRVKSAGAISDNVRDASEQISRSGLPGMVFLDLSVAFNPEGEDVVRPMTADQFRSCLKYAMTLLLRSHEPTIKARAASRGVGVVYTFFSCLRSDPIDGWEFATMHMDLAIGEIDEAGEALLEFRAAYDCGIKALTPN
jgi:hypothetical protein